MRNPTQIRLYDIFRKDLRMPDDRAQNLVSVINEALNDHSEQEKEDLATKSFVREEILATREFVVAEFKSFRGEVKEEFKFVRAGFNSLKDQFSSLKDQFRDREVSIARQIFLANLIQFLAIVGAVLAIYTFLRK